MRTVILAGQTTRLFPFAPAARSAEEEWQKDIIFTVESLILAQDER